MSAADLAVVLVAVATLAALVLLVVTLMSVVRATRELRMTLERLQRDTLPILGSMQATVEQAGAEVERVDELLEAAVAIQQTVDSASRLTYVAMAHPLIRVVAFFRGLGRGSSRALGRGGRRRRRLEAKRAAREVSEVAVRKGGPRKVA
jgi:predicted PurR-regulated permease PerM